MNSQRTLAEHLRLAQDSLSPAEKRVSRVLLADYPVAGLERVHSLAERANVSAPTVLRLLTRLGVGSYPQMQQLLREEIAASTSSPLEMYEGQEDKKAQDNSLTTGYLARARKILLDGVEDTFASLPEGEVLKIVELLANSRYRIWTVGGRFSDNLAQYLSTHLKLLRRDVNHVGTAEHDKAFALIDFGPKDVVVAFDYRRYQDSTIEFLRSAKGSKSTTILFTDPWLSPAAKHADFLLSSSVAAPSPFDSHTAAYALVESIIAGVFEELGDAPRSRLQAFDKIEQRTLHSLRATQQSD